MKIAEFLRNNLFSAYKTNVPSDNPFVKTNEYYCLECSQKFSAHWDIRANRFNSWVPRGSWVLCPYCGKRHFDNVLYVKRGQFAPFKIHIKLYEFKTKIILQVDYFAQLFQETLYKIDREEGSEIFTFDFEKQTTFFEKVTKNYYTDEKKRQDLIFLKINRGTAGRIIEKSILQYLHADSYVYKDKNLAEVIKSFYKSIRKKMLFYQKDIQNLYINTKGLPDGLFLRAILNYAIKIDGKDTYINRYEKISSNYVLQKVNIGNATKKEKNSIIEYCKAGRDIVSAIIKTYGVEDKKSIRTEIASGADISQIKLSLQTFKNFDIAMRFHKVLRKKGVAFYIEDQLKFISLAKKRYKETEIIDFIEKNENSKVSDIFRMFKRLDRGYRKQFLKEKIQINRLHEYLIYATNKQKEDNYEKVKLKVPKNVVNRVVMQIENSHFYLPENSLELFKAGRELHNCVSGYTDRINSQGKENIVFMADHNGKLLACINIRNNYIVEAKQRKNKPVWEDDKLNNEIVEWSRKAKLKINTPDIREEHYRTAKGQIGA